MPFHSILIVLVHVSALVAFSVYSVFSFSDVRFWAAIWILPVSFIGIRACCRGRLVCGGPHGRRQEFDISINPKEFYLCMRVLVVLAWMTVLIPMFSR